MICGNSQFISTFINKNFNKISVIKYGLIVINMVNKQPDLACKLPTSAVKKL